MSIELFFSVLGMFLTLIGNFMSLKPSFLTKSLSALWFFMGYGPLDVRIWLYFI